MHKPFVKILFTFVLVIWTVDKADCKQGACLSYGHSCWGAHGKRNVDVPTNPNAWFAYRMSLMQKSANRDASPTAADRGQAAQDEYAPPNYFNMLKMYMQKNALKKTNGYSDDTIDRGTEWKWNVQPNKDVPNGRTYYEEQVFDPRMEYKLMKI